LDHRFQHPAWQQFPFRAWQQGFLAVQNWWDYATDTLRGLEQQHADRTRYMARQALDLISPSNFPVTNNEILAATAREGGRNLIEVAVHLAQDFIQTATERRGPPPKGCRPSKELACKPGKVVFHNYLFELIQYAPSTDQVQAEPILIVPAWIMKYYIPDLSPQNSMVMYSVDRGFAVFMISWTNPSAEQAGLWLENYRKRGGMAALNAIAAIQPDRLVHALGYCLGGTILATAAATMARDGDERLASITLMAAQVDFVEAGERLLFLDESQVASIEDMM